MTLCYIDGLEDLGSIVANNGTPTLVTARTGNGVQVPGNTGWVQMRFPAPYFDTVTVGFAMRPSTIAGNSDTPATFSLLGDAGATNHLSMNLVGGNISVARGNATTPVLIATTTPPFPTAPRWYYVEFQAKLSDTAGFININVDGVNVLTSATNLDTRNAGTGAVFDTAQFGMGLSGSCIFDDVYLAAGTTADAFLGDCVVNTLSPNGNGTTNQFLGSDGNSVNNWELVDELPPSGTDYVGSAVMGEQDLYTLTDAPSSAGSIIAVAPTVYAAKDEVGPRQVKPLLRRTTTYAGAAVSLDFAYAQKQMLFTTDPETGAAWTTANVNALQAGVEVA